MIFYTGGSYMRLVLPANAASIVDMTYTPGKLFFPPAKSMLIVRFLGVSLQQNEPVLQGLERWSNINCHSVHDRRATNHFSTRALRQGEVTKGFFSSLQRHAVPVTVRVYMFILKKKNGREGTVAVLLGATVVTCALRAGGDTSNKYANIYIR